MPYIELLSPAEFGARAPVEVLGMQLVGVGGDLESRIVDEEIDVALTPSSPSRTAMAWPMPELPPVTTATLPCNPFPWSSSMPECLRALVVCSRFAPAAAPTFHGLFRNPGRLRGTWLA